LVPSRPCLVCAVPYLNVQVPVLALWGQDSLSPKGLLDTVDFQDLHIQFSSDPKKLLMLIVILAVNE